MTSIRGIPVRVVEVIELVRHMCPSLEEAAFFETSFSYNDYFKEKTKATPQLIQSALKKWPKVNKPVFIPALFSLIKINIFSPAKDSDHQQYVPKVCPINFERVRPSITTFNV